MDKKKKNVLKKIEMKEEKATQNFEESKKVLQTNFDVNIKKLTQHIDEQRFTVSNSYGPLSLKDKKLERPIFEIRKDVDQEGFEKQNDLMKEQAKIPQILNVTLKTCRCLKDKVSPGYFIVKVKVLSRIGGTTFDFDIEEQYENYKRMSEELRYFNK